MARYSLSKQENIIQNACHTQNFHNESKFYLRWFMDGISITLNVKFQV